DRDAIGLIAQAQNGGKDDLFKLAEGFGHILPTLYDKSAPPSKSSSTDAQSFHLGSLCSPVCLLILRPFPCYQAFGAGKRRCRKVARSAPRPPGSPQTF